MVSHNLVLPLETRATARCTGPVGCKQCRLEQLALAALQGAFPDATETQLRVMLDDVLRMLPSVH